MADSQIRKIVTREAALLFGLVFVGLILAPAIIFVIGQNVFGTYGGQGFGDYFSTLSGKIRSGEPAAWFFVLSPYLAWQLLRLTWLGWRLAGKANST